jgi:hypothetical protein
MGHEHQGPFEKGNLALRIETFEGEVYFLDGIKKRFVNSYDIFSFKSTLTKEERQIQNEMTDTALKIEINGKTIECLKEVISGEVNIKTRNKILAEVKIKIQQNKLDEAELLLSVLEKYYTSDIFVFYLAVKIPFIKKNWPKVQCFREKYILVPD